MAIWDSKAEHVKLRAAKLATARSNTIVASVFRDLACKHTRTAKTEETHLRVVEQTREHFMLPFFALEFRIGSLHNQQALVELA